MHRNEYVPLNQQATASGTPAVPPRITADHRDFDRRVRTLHQRWVTVVDGCFETEMESGDGEPSDALRAAWARALEHAAEVKRELDGYVGEPLHDQLTEHHLLRLAQATGLMRPGHTVGEGLREVCQLLADVRPLQQERPGWLARRRREAEESQLIRAARGGW